MATEAALVARLEARMDKYEKAMKGAEETADKTVKGIENSFSSTTLGTTIGTTIGNAIGSAVKSAADAVDKLIERFNSLTDTARTTGLSLGQVFALQGTGDPDKINAALEKMNTLLDKAKRGEDNSLAKILKLNDIDVANVKDVFDLWTKIAALVKNAANVEQGKQIAEAAGAGRELEQALMKAADQGDRLNETAAKMDPQLRKIADAALQFQAAWDAAVSEVKRLFAEAWPTIKAELIKFLEDMQRALEEFANTFAANWARSMADAAGRVAGTLAGTIGGDAKPLAITVNPSGGKRSVPPAVGGSGGSSGADKLDALEREQRRATERTAQMELEGKLIGQNVETRTRELEILRLTQMAEREKIPLTEAVRMKIDEQAEAYGRAAGKLDELLRKNQQSVQLQTFVGNTLVDTLMKATEAGAKFADIMADVAKQIARAALQALILGQGPLAGLFGTAPTAAGQTGGLIGNLFKTLPKFQSGGVVPGSGPVPIMAHGGEVVVPAAQARQVGGATVAISQTIDARGAQLGVGEQIAAALSANNRALQTNLPAMIRSAQSRGAIR